MYESFFGLTKSPFAMTPDPAALYLTNSHREAIAGLSYAVMRRKGFVLLIGEAGTGKTTLLRKLLEIAPETKARTIVMPNPLLTPAEFLELFLLNLGLRDVPQSKAQRLILLEEQLVQMHAKGDAAVLVIDEAHKLSFELLEEIRLLTNFETTEQKLLQIVLAGQPELNAVMNRQELWQLKQRVAIRLKIEALTQIQVGEYLAYRWTRAGGSGELPFTQQAILQIAYWSKGIPRLINSISDNALLTAYSRQSKTVSPREVLEVVNDLDIGPAGDRNSMSVGSSVGSSAPAREGDAKVRNQGTPPAEPVAADPVRLATLERYAKPASKLFFFQRWTARLGLG